MKTATKKITKADIIAYGQCPRLSYLNKTLPPPDKKPEFFAKEGNAVTKIAQKFFGVDVTIDEKTKEESMELTSQALSESKLVAEADFQSEQIGLRLDMARQDDDGLHFTEIKSSTHSSKNIKKYLPDVAAQIALLSARGTRLSSASLALLNPGARGADAKDLFVQTDVTKKATAMAKEINFTRIAEVINHESPPAQTFHRSCPKCDHLSSCFPQYPEEKATVHIPRISFKKLETMHNDEIYLGTKVSDEKLTPKQLTVVQTWRTKKEIIDHDALEAAFHRLSPENRRQNPVHFLDFEAAQPAIPLYADHKPYTRLPFQYSLHTRPHGGDTDHKEFLHDNLSDPTTHFLESLISVLGDSEGPIVVYTRYEKDTLYSAINRHPEFSASVEKLINRLFDLHEVVKASLWHPDANGLTSIKTILPLLSKLSYDDLDIQNGLEAVEGWMEYRKSPTKKMRENLLTYCKLDSQAMIDILDALADRRRP